MLYDHIIKNHGLFEINKIIAAILLIALIVIIGKISDMAYVNKPEKYIQS